MRALWTWLVLLFALLGQASAQTQRHKYPEVYTMSPMGVNIQTGAYHYSKQDFAIGSLKFVRTWKGQEFREGLTASDPFGFGHWSHNFTFSIAPREEPPSGYFLDVYSDGPMARFARVSTSPFVIPGSPEAQGTTLTQHSWGNYTFENRNGDVYTFTNSQATQVDYADGTRLVMSYSGTLLRTIISSRGDAIVLDYVGGRLTTACGYNRANHYVTLTSTCSSGTPEVKVHYGYSSVNGTWVLSSITDASNNVSTMQYAFPSGNSGVVYLGCVTLPNSSTCPVTSYYEDTIYMDRVSRQVTATGETWSYSYSYRWDSDYEYGGRPGEVVMSSRTMTDPGGRASWFSYADGLLKEADLREGAQAYEWDGVEAKSFTSAGGNRIVLARDARQNVLSMTRKAVPGSGDADIVTSSTYSEIGPNCISTPIKTCNKPLSTTDERGGQTDYTHDSAHGGVLTETGPAVNGVRPQARYTYVQRYAWIRNSGGGYTQAETPIWLLARKSICKTGAASGAGCAVAGDEVLTTYDYGPDSGPNTLLLRGQVEDAGGVAARTCFTYDALGRKISETKPRAGLAVCA